MKAPDKTEWHILHRDGSVMKEEELPTRPDDARQVKDGQVFTPWYKENEHVHVEGGKIKGIHAKGTLERVQAILKKVLENESKLLEHFGPEEDMLLEEVLEVLED